MMHFTFIIPGYYDCKLFVSDEAGHTAYLDFMLTIIDTEKPISIAGQNLTIENGDMVVFDGSRSTDNLMIENYTWSFDYDDEVVYLYGALHSFYFIILFIFRIPFFYPKNFIQRILLVEIFFSHFLCDKNGKWLF